MNGLRLLATRLAQAVPVLLLVAVLSFFLMHLLPGDPAVVIAGADASAEAIARLRAEIGLDRPLPEQLLQWVVQLAQGNFGRSLGLNQSVLSAAMLVLAVVVPAVNSGLRQVKKSLLSLNLLQDRLNAYCDTLVEEPTSADASVVV